jgi:XRE family aerobic/anaerobic benzoate catabolism transcriptional regulator
MKDKNLDLASDDDSSVDDEDRRDYLRALGERIHDLRLRRGMTRADLVRGSGVSLRFLAKLEGGDGNISVVRLRRVAQALAMPLEDVVRVGSERPPELTLLIEYLSRLTLAQLSGARQMLMSAFEKDGRRDRIALIGLRGAGKSTLGRMLAEQRKVRFVELAGVIEKLAGVPLAEIFSLYGQAAYRRYEKRALEWILAEYDAFVMSVGGSIVTEPVTFDELLTSCCTIWVKASPAEHLSRVIEQGDRRPMMGDDRQALRDLQRILDGREPMYSKADITIDTTGAQIHESFAEMLKRLAI